jgi:hypothetical protein
MKNIVVLIVSLCILFYIFLPAPVQTFTVYKMNCPDVTSNEAKCPAKQVPEKHGYKVFIDEQFVVSQAGLSRYNECIIYDRRNWACNADKTIINVTNGKETVYARESEYPSSDAFNDANETLQSEMARSPQINIFNFYINKAKHLAGR